MYHLNHPHTYSHAYPPPHCSIYNQRVSGFTTSQATWCSSPAIPSDTTAQLCFVKVCDKVMCVCGSKVSGCAEDELWGSDGNPCQQRRVWFQLVLPQLRLQANLELELSRHLRWVKSKGRLNMQLNSSCCVSLSLKSTAWVNSKLMYWCNLFSLTCCHHHPAALQFYPMPYHCSPSLPHPECLPPWLHQFHFH